jgi:hypothetical protein
MTSNTLISKIGEWRTSVTESVYLPFWTFLVDLSKPEIVCTVHWTSNGCSVNNYNHLKGLETQTNVFFKFLLYFWGSCNSLRCFLSSLTVLDEVSSDGKFTVPNLINCFSYSCLDSSNSPTKEDDGYWPPWERQFHWCELDTEYIFTRQQHLGLIHLISDSMHILNII